MIIPKPNRNKKEPTFFLSKTQPIKSHGLFVYCNPLNLLSPSIKVASCCARTCSCLSMVVEPMVWFSADRDKAFTGERTASLCFSSTFCLFIWKSERNFWRLWGLWENRCNIHNWVHRAPWFSPWQWSLKVCIYSESRLMPSFHLKLSRLYLGSILKFPPFWLRYCSIYEYSLELWFDFVIRPFQSKLAEKALAHSFGGAGAFLLKFWQFFCWEEILPVLHFFGIGAVLWELAEKPSVWLPWYQAVFLELAGISTKGYLSYKLWIELLKLLFNLLFFYSRENPLKNGILAV